MASLPLADRRLLAQRMLTVHVFSVIRGRPRDFEWSQQDRDWVASLMTLMADKAPGFDAQLPLSKKRAFDAAKEGDLSEVGEVLRNASYIENRLPSSVHSLLDPHFWLYRKPSDWVCTARRMIDEKSWVV